MNQTEKIGIAFSGGGLQGISHIGVIRAFEELGVKPNAISGTSSGSIFACLYAMGYTSSDMEEFAKESWKKLSTIKKSTIFKMALDFFFHGKISQEGVIDGKIIEEVLGQIVQRKKLYTMSDLPISTALCSVDTYSTDETIFLSHNPGLSKDHMIYLSNIPITTAIRASMSFPGIYNSCSYGEYNFIDGGTKDNLPVEVLQDLGMDQVIAISFDYKNYHPNRGIINLFLRVLDIFPSDKLRASKQKANLLIRIADDDTALLEIEDFSATIQKGYDAVMLHKEEILNLIHQTISN